MSLNQDLRKDLVIVPKRTTCLVVKTTKTMQKESLQSYKILFRHIFSYLLDCHGVLEVGLAMRKVKMFHKEVKRNQKYLLLWEDLSSFLHSL